MAARKQAPRVEFSQEIFDQICERLADGGSLRVICEEKGMPDRSTFNRWRKRSVELQMQYDDAYREAEQAILDDMRYIGDTAKDPALARVQIDQRKWELKIRNRKVYGDHVTEEITGPNGGPLQIERVRLNMQPVDELPE